MIKYPNPYDAAFELMQLYAFFEDALQNRAEALGYYQNEDISEILANENYHTLNRILNF